MSSEQSVTVLVSFFFQAEDGIRDSMVTGVQTRALPIYVQVRLRPLKLLLCHLRFLPKSARLPSSGGSAPDATLKRQRRAPNRPDIVAKKRHISHTKTPERSKKSERKTLPDFARIMEPTPGLEPGTPSLPWMCLKGNSPSSWHRFK